MEDSINQKNEIVIKLLHYFITDLNYNPIILQGIENEIWLENLDCDYKVVRIVSSHIHNEEQMQFDVYKTNVSVVTQKSILFSMSIRDNLSLVDSNIERQQEVCKRLGIHDEILSLPQGYQTIILDNGSQGCFLEFEIIDTPEMVKGERELFWI